jgi:Zn-dependent M32 family carboxypeptidase
MNIVAIATLIIVVISTVIMILNYNFHSSSLGFIENKIEKFFSGWKNSEEKNNAKFDQIKASADEIVKSASEIAEVAKENAEDYALFIDKSKSSLQDLESTITTVKKAITKSSKEINQAITDVEREKIRAEIMKEETYIRSMEDRIKRLQKIKDSRDLEVVSVISRLRISEIELRLTGIKEIISKSIASIEHGHIQVIYNGVNLNKCKKIMTELYKLQLGKREINHAEIVDPGEETSWLEVNSYINVSSVKKNKVTYSCTKEQYDNFISLYNNVNESKSSDVEKIERMIDDLSQQFSHLLHESESIANQIDVSDVI